MADAATPKDFEELVSRTAAKSVADLGRKSAAIAADAAAKGALSSNRIVFLYADALERSWARAADTIMGHLRRWVSETKIGRTPLRNTAEQQLRRLIPALIEASKVRRPSEFRNQAILESAQQRVDAIEADLIYRLRQFDIDMDVSPSSKPRLWWEETINWVGNHLAQIVVGLLVLAIGSLAGLS